MTKEKCIELGKKCNSKTNFARTYYMAYIYAQKNNLLNTLFPKKEFTLEECIEEAKKYKNRSSFGRFSTPYYNLCKKNGWLDIIFGENTTKPKKFWDEKTCEEESKKYKCRNDFCKFSSGAYSKAKKNNWLEKYTWLTTPLISEHRNETENIIYSYEDPINKIVYVGRTINLQKRHSQHNTKNHRTKRYDAIKEHFEKQNLSLPNPIILEKVSTYVLSQEKEHFWVEKYKENGWILLNKAKTGIGCSAIGGGYVKWTYDKCLEESKKYKTRMEFKNCNGGAYSAAVKNKWISNFKFEEIQKPFRYWYNYENNKTEASKYNTKREFRLGNTSAYNIAKKMNWLEGYFKK